MNDLFAYVSTNKITNDKILRQTQLANFLHEIQTNNIPLTTIITQSQSVMNASHIRQILLCIRHD